jgi:hypothetical protein
MRPREFQCTYCGFNGIIRRGHSEPDDPDKLFKRLGRNPLSGHLHYQCPACSVVLLVSPEDVKQAKSPGDAPCSLSEGGSPDPAIWLRHSRSGVKATFFIPLRMP